MNRLTESVNGCYSRAHVRRYVGVLIAVAACQSTPPATPPAPPTSGSGPLHLTSGNGANFSATVVFAPGGGGGAGKRAWTYTVFNTAERTKGGTQDGGISEVTLHTPKDITVCKVEQVTPTSFSATFPSNQDVKVAVTSPTASYVGDSVVTFVITDCDALNNVSDDLLIKGFDWATKASGSTTFPLAGPEGKP